MSEVTVTVSGPIGSGKSAIAGEIEIAMRAIGIKVRYADPNGAESEKRLTHADWQQAIEDCNPSVVIVEAAPSPAPESEDVRLLRSALKDLLDQVESLQGYELTRDIETYKADACWEDAQRRARELLL